MPGAKRWAYLLAGVVVALSAIDGVWARFPGILNPVGFAAVNLAGGVLLLVATAILLLRLKLRWFWPPPGLGRPRAVLALVALLAVANLLALGACQWRPCFFLAYVDAAVPVGWYIGARLLLNRVGKTR